MSSDAIIFDLKYTPYKLHKGATKDDIKKQAEERAFYDLSGEENILKYMTTEGKLAVKERCSNFTALEYLQKNTGVFNQNGMIEKDEVEDMKKRAKKNQGNLWHGFISLSENDSPNIDTPEKCIELIKRTFNSFFEEGHFTKSNIDLMCALHLDKPHHLHIHFCFWEKEPKKRLDNGKLTFRAKGNVCKKAIDNMYVRIAEFIDKGTNNTYIKRDDALKELKGLVKFRNINASQDEILKAILSLKKDLPKTGRYSYGAEEMKPYRERVDEIVSMLLMSNGEAQNANANFKDELKRKERRIKAFCGAKKRFDDGSGKFRYQIDEKNITVIEDIEKDYKRRQGNLVLNLIKAIDPEYYERSKKWKYETNCKKLKRSLTISKRKVKSIFQQFFLTFGVESLKLERDFSHRLQEVEEEMEREREKQNKLSKGGNIKD